LVRQLLTARDALQAWDKSLRTIAIQSAGVSPTSPPSQTAVLLAIVSEARQGVDRRLAELGINETEHSPVHVKNSAMKRRSRSAAESSLELCINACRACGRALGSAFREAQKVADNASARILYGSIRDLEKQLWVLDPHQAH
jgi:hypothetical protein